MQVKLGGKFWEIDETLPEDEQAQIVLDIKTKLWEQGIDPMALSPDEEKKYQEHMRKCYLSQCWKPTKK